MAKRNIREIGDSILRKRAKPVGAMTLRTELLIRDMFETMYDAEGVGLAAPQVGVLKRIFVIDVDGDGDPGTQKYGPLTFINPEILSTEGEQTGPEGCLSIPGKHAAVTRPMTVRVRALNRKMETFTLEATGLLARCICHENDHLDGILYVDRALGPLVDNAAGYEAEEEEAPAPEEDAGAPDRSPAAPGKDGTGKDADT